MLQTVDRYILKEILQTWFAVTLVLLLILLSNRLARYLSQAVAGDLPSQVIFPLLGLKTLSSVGLLGPLSFYLAIMLTLGRLYKDSEMAALGACGIGPARLYRTLFTLAVPSALFIAALTFFVSPWAAERGHVIRAEAEGETDISGISPGRFKESSQGNRIFYVESLSEDRQEVNNIFVHGVDRDGVPGMLSSESGYQYVDEKTGDRFMVAVDGYRYQGRPGDPDYKIIKFEKHAVRIKEKEVMDSGQEPIEAVATAKLISEPRSDYVAELQWRISMPLALLVLTMLALPLGRVSPRQGRYAKVIIGIVIYILYVNVLGTARVSVERGTVSPWLGVWWVHASIVALGAFLMVRMVGLRWLKIMGRRR
jgi:lipopolysaccharide export system permease protein